MASCPLCCRLEVESLALVLVGAPPPVPPAALLPPPMLLPLTLPSETATAAMAGAGLRGQAPPPRPQPAHPFSLPSWERCHSCLETWVVPRQQLPRLHQSPPWQSMLLLVLCLPLRLRPTSLLPPEAQVAQEAGSHGPRSHPSVAALYQLLPATPPHPQAGPPPSTVGTPHTCSAWSLRPSPGAQLLRAPDPPTRPPWPVLRHAAPAPWAPLPGCLHHPRLAAPPPLLQQLSLLLAQLPTPAAALLRSAALPALRSAIFGTRHLHPQTPSMPPFV
mmetsp:Transcript_21590/g.59862  ORF Transcript_21590/g.59862 Transcript_21590/m.59862 type:complete len:275 (-) Transcript_21590:524-1348(-)